MIIGYEPLFSVFKRAFQKRFVIAVIRDPRVRSITRLSERVLQSAVHSTYTAIV